MTSLLKKMSQLEREALALLSRIYSTGLLFLLLHPRSKGFAVWCLRSFPLNQLPASAHRLCCYSSASSCRAAATTMQRWEAMRNILLLQTSLSIYLSDNFFLRLPAFEHKYYTFYFFWKNTRVVCFKDTNSVENTFVIMYYSNIKEDHILKGGWFRALKRSRFQSSGK